MRAMLIFLSFLLCYVDLTLGMGYGTLLSPLLLAIGFKPSHIVSAVLTSQLMGDALAVIFHHLFGNASFNVQSWEFRNGLKIGVSGIISAIIAYFININIDEFILKIYTSLITITMGALVFPSKTMIEKHINDKNNEKKTTHFVYCG